MGVRGQGDGNARPICSLITPIALPIVPAGIQEGMRRYRDHGACVVNFSIPSIALPTAAPGGARQIRVGGQFDCDACLVDSGVASSAFPAPPAGAQEGVRGYIAQRACFVGLSIASIALPSTSIALHVVVERGFDGTPCAAAIPGQRATVSKRISNCFVSCCSCSWSFREAAGAPPAALLR